MLLHLVARIVASGATFACTPVAVWDGDGPIWCAEGPRIRLHGIAAREIKRVDGQTVEAGCKPGHPCGRVSGVVARDRLVKLLGGPRGTLSTGHVKVTAATMTCRSYGWGKGSRTAASCSLPWLGDISCAMVRAGVVVRWAEYGGDRMCR